MNRQAPPHWMEALLERLLRSARNREGVLGDLAEGWRRLRRHKPALVCDLWYAAQSLSLIGWGILSSARGTARPGLIQDLRQTVRTLLRQPGFSAVVVVTLALAIGANAAVFGIADRLLLRGPEHVRDPDGILRVSARWDVQARGVTATDVFGYVTYSDLASGADALAGIAAYSLGAATTGTGIDARSMRVGYATSSFFPLLGVSPHLGRFFGPNEEGAWGSEDVAVLDYGLWRREYGANPEVIGTSIDIGEEQFVIVGVAPAGFTGVDLLPVDLWLPLPARGRRFRGDWATNRHSSWLRIIARVDPRIGVQRAEQQATAVHRAAATAAAPDELRSGARLEFLPLGLNSSGEESPERPVLRWLVGLAGIVLLIAIANVSSLQLARGARRRREVAVRVALGIGRGRLIGLFLLESLVLAGAGALLGLAVAHFGGGLVRAVLLPDIAWTKPPVNGRVLAFSAVTALAAAVVVGLTPALAARRTDPARSLQLGVRSGGTGGGRVRGALLVVQPALALVLLVGAGLFVRSLIGVRNIDLGFDADHVLVASPSWSSAVSGDPATVGAGADHSPSAVDAAKRARDHFARLPWVQSASLSLGLPFYTSFGVRVRPRDTDTPPPSVTQEPSIMGVSREYFATVGTRRLRGRLFDARDAAATEPVTVVNEAMASVFWPGQEALDRCLTVYDDAIPCVRVVGVVQNVKQWSLTGDAPPMFYVPIEQAREIDGPLLLIRPTGNADEAIERVRAELLRLWPDLPWVNIFPIQRQIDPQVRPWRMGALLFSLFGLLALVVAGSGLYSVLAYLVEQRRHELGVRAALGASSRELLGETVRRGLAPATFGLAIGGLLALPLGHRLEPLLYQTTGHDPLVFGLAGGLLLVVALAGTLVPALRASRADPVTALREE